MSGAVPGPADVAIIIVSWNVRELLRDCLLSLRAHPSTVGAQHLVVVDNNSEDGSAAMVATEFPDVQLIRNATNRGFTGGNNDGLRAAHALLASGPMAQQCVLLLNPDTVVHAGAIDTLVDTLLANPDTGIVGPQLRYGDGSLQSTRRRFPSLAVAMFESTWLQGIGPRMLLDRYYARDLPEGSVCDVDWLVGAALLVRVSAYAKIGGLDEENFFMYSEELDWCRRFKAAGWRIVYQPAAVITHLEGRSSAQVSVRRMVHFNTSKVRYFRKYHGRGQARILAVWLALQFAWQASLEWAKAMLGSQPGMRRARAKGYVEVLRALRDA